MKRALYLFSRTVIIITLLFLLAACSGGSKSGLIDVTPTATLDTQSTSGTATDSAQSDESSKLIGSIQTPEPTATPGPLTRQISRVSARTGLDETFFLGVSVEDWINLAISLLLILGSYFLGTWFVRGLAGWVFQRTSNEVGSRLVGLIGDLVRWVVVVLFVQFATNRLDFLGAELKELLSDLYFVLAWVLFLRITWRLINLGVERVSQRLNQRGRGDEITPVIKLLDYSAKAIAVVIFLGILLAHFGINLYAFIAALGIGGLALSLALKDTIANFISGIIILIDQPFRVHDRIYVPSVNTWADVVEIGLRSTKVLTRDNRYITFPNGTLTNAEIVNYTYPDPSYRLQIDVGIAYGTDIEKARNVLKDTVKSVEGVFLEKPVDVLYNEMGDSAMIFRVRWWIASYKDKRHVIDRVNTALQNALDEAGIESPYPTQALYHHFDPEIAIQVTGKDNKTIQE